MLGLTKIGEKMISPNDAGKGLIFRYKGKMLKLLDRHHVKLSKGGACQQAKCLDLKNGSTFELRLNVNDDLEQVYVEKKNLQFMYFDGTKAQFYYYDEKTGDSTQLEIDPASLGEKTPLFSMRDANLVTESGEPIMLQIEFVEDNGEMLIIDSEILNDLTFEVENTSPSLKGEMAKPTYKPAILKGGLKVTVPPHVENGDKIVLNKKNLSYEGKSK